MTGTVFKFEFLNAIKKKTFIITISIMLVLLLLMTFIPKIISMFSGDEEEEVYGIVSDLDFLQAEDASAVTGLSFTTYDTVDQLKEAIESGELKAGVLYEGGSRSLFVKSTSMSQVSNDQALMKKLSFLEAREDIVNAGLTESEADRLLNTERPFQTIPLTVDGAKSFWMIYVNIFVLYFLILTFGNMVTMTVAREKSDRTMELLITSVKPKDLIRGKVYAYGLVGILTLLILYGGAYLGMRIGGDSSLEMIQSLNIQIDLNQLIVSLCYFVVGYIMYLFLFASAGSLVSRMEDVNMAVQPIIMIFVIGFLISMIGLGKPGTFLDIASYVPFTSPLAMVVRYGVSYVSETELAISFGILVVTTILIRMFAVKMYRLGSLNYGTKVNFFKSLFQTIKS